jgi:hypothetical protein
LDLDALTKQLPALEAERDEWRKRERDAGSRAENLDRIIEGIRGLAAGQGLTDANGRKIAALAPVIRPEDNAGLSGIEAVRTVLLEQPERIWRARDVHNVLEDRGWISPGNQNPSRSTEASIQRLHKRGQLEKVRTGRYRVTERLRRSMDED